MALQNMFGPQPSAPATGGISGVRFNRPTGWVDEYGGNGELTGASNWGSYFTGLNNLGEGQAIQGIQSIGGANPTGFTVTRADPNGDENVYQNRTLTLNPDGTVGWADGSDWKSHTQQSQLSHFLSAGLPMALAMAGGMYATGGFGGATGAGAASGTGAGTATGGTTAGSGLIPGTGTTGLQVGAGQGLGSTIGAGAGVTEGIAGSGLLPSAAGSTAGAGAAAGGLGSILNGATGGPGNVIRNVVGGALNGGSSGGGQGGNGISTITDLLNIITNGVGYNKYDNLMDEIKQIYSPEGAYAKTLENRLARQDAASGRNSQYGPRLAQLMGSLGESQARALQGLGGMIDEQQGSVNGVGGSIDRLVGGAAQGGLNAVLNSIFGSGDSGGSTSGPDWSGVDWDNWFDI